MTFQKRGMGLIPWPSHIVGTPAGGDLFADLATQLKLPDMGLYTPWGWRSTAVDWIPVDQPPSTNIAVSSLNDAAWKIALTIGFGQALPFIGVLTTAPQMADLVLPSIKAFDSAWKGTQYEVFETQAIYSQTDKRPTPQIHFLTWLRLRDIGDPDKGNGSLERAATESGGRLVFAGQVDYASTATRSTPATPFETALEQQLGVAPPGLPSGPPEPMVEPPPVGPAPPTEQPASGGFNWKPWAVAAGLATGTFLVARKVIK